MANSNTSSLFEGPMSSGMMRDRAMKEILSPMSGMGDMSPLGSSKLQAPNTTPIDYNKMGEAFSRALKGEKQSGAGLSSAIGGMTGGMGMNLMQKAFDTALGPVQKVLGAIATMLGLLVMPIINLVLPLLIPVLQLLGPFIRWMNMLFQPVLQAEMAQLQNPTTKAELSNPKTMPEGMASIAAAGAGALFGVIGTAITSSLGLGNNTTITTAVTDLLEVVAGYFVVTSAISALGTALSPLIVLLFGSVEAPLVATEAEAEALGASGLLTGLVADIGAALTLLLAGIGGDITALSAGTIGTAIAGIGTAVLALAAAFAPFVAGVAFFTSLWGSAGNVPGTSNATAPSQGPGWYSMSGQYQGNGAAPNTTSGSSASNSTTSGMSSLTNEFNNAIKAAQATLSQNLTPSLNLMSTQTLPTSQKAFSALTNVMSPMPQSVVTPFSNSLITAQTEVAGFTNSLVTAIKAINAALLAAQAAAAAAQAAAASAAASSRSIQNYANSNITNNAMSRAPTYQS